MRGSERTGEKTVLPKVAGSIAAGVQVLSVAAVYAAEEDGQRFGATWRDDPVDVIRHEAPGLDTDLAVVKIGGREGEIRGAVHVGEEDVVAVYPSLGDVVGASGFDTTSVPRHI